MLMIRLQRVGRKNDPSFRVVVVDSHEPAKTGNVIEVVGNYDARKGEPVLKADRVMEWMSKGAQVSDTVNNLLVKTGIIKGQKKNVASKKLGKKAQADKAKKTTEEKEASAVTEEAPAEEAAAELKKESKLEPEEEAIDKAVKAELVETPADEKSAETPVAE